MYVVWHVSSLKIRFPLSYRIAILPSLIFLIRCICPEVQPSGSSSRSLCSSATRTIQFSAICALRVISWCFSRSFT